MKNFGVLLTLCILLTHISCFPQAGTLDTTFGGDGTIKTRIGDRRASGQSIAIQADEKIVLAGTYFGTNENYDFALARYKSNGKIDSSFGVNGRVVTDFESREYGRSIAIQKDGKILMAGYTDGTTSDFIVARYKKNGKPDSSFGENGKVTTDFGDRDEARSIAIQPDGKILVAGSTLTDFKFFFALVRYNNDGKKDTSFGLSGKVIYLKGGANSLAIQNNGKIVVAGASGNDFALLRFDTNGKPDGSFGVNGEVTTDFGRGDYAHSIAMQADGKIVAAGNSGNVTALARYLQNGELDEEFGEHGKVLSGTQPVQINSAAIQQDGKIVAAGYRRINGEDDFYLVRYQQNGKIDSSFGQHGEVSTDFGNYDWGESIVLQADGKIVLGGTSANSFAVARYNADNPFTAIASNTNNNFSNLQKRNNTSAGICIFPNPVRDLIHIEGPSNSSKVISVIDAKGRLCQQVTTANNSYSFNTKNLSTGIYFVRVIEGGKTTTLKFSKE